jgi:glycosyltransferase involved in cell wall biosynthesis
MSGGWCGSAIERGREAVKIALVADAYAPLRTSAAVQLRDLARALTAQGHAVTVLAPAPGQAEACTREDDAGVEVLRLRAWPTKGLDWTRRTLTEFALPFLMWRALRATGRDGVGHDAVVWYSPSIFLTPLVARLKRASRAPAYLIIRDIFPEWAADMGLIRRGPAFHLLKWIAACQFAAADVIGVQSPGNLPYFARWTARGKRVEVLHNWIAPPAADGEGIDLSVTLIAGRRVVVYAGNMGVAQGMDKVLRLIADSRKRRDVGFLMIGGGSEAARLAAEADARGLDNVVFHPEIEPDRLGAVYAQAAVGLVALDARHKTHNIPGKFIGYVAAGLPVLATVNPGNDLVALVEEARVGLASTDPDGGDLAALLARLLEVEDLPAMADRARALAASRFAADAAAAQIVSALRTR